MEFLRRGAVKVPHKPSAYIWLTQLTGTPIKCVLRTISCWEEHLLNQRDKIVTVFFTNLSNVPVRETFDAIDAEINGKAVAS